MLVCISKPTPSFRHECRYHSYDDFQTLIYGVFRPQVDGDHTFGIDWPDDRGSFWVDLDQDGRFEVEGNHGNEWMNEGSQAGYKTVSLKRGQVYNIAIAHNEGNGNSRVVSAVTAPGVVRQTLNPAGLEQEGMWGVRNPIDFNKVESTPLATRSRCSGQ